MFGVACLFTCLFVCFGVNNEKELKKKENKKKNKKQNKKQNKAKIIISTFRITFKDKSLRGVEWVHGLFLFPHVLGKMYLQHAKLGLFCVV